MFNKDLTKIKSLETTQFQGFSYGRGFKDLNVCGGFTLHTFRSATEILTNFSTRLTLLAKNVPPAHFLTPKPSRVQVIYCYTKNKNRHLTVSVSIFGRGFKDLFSPAGSVGASKHLRCLEVSTGHPHPSARSACRVFKPIYTNEKEKAPTESVLFFLAGAEGLEPSARGFGDRCSTN